MNYAIRYEADGLLEFATQLLTRTGLADERARVVAEVLLEGDLLGHTTHGLDLLPRYLGELQAGRMARAGEPETLSDRGCALTWDGKRLPGPWLVRQAIRAARQRLERHPLAVVVIRRSHHIACLQAYLKPVTDYVDVSQPISFYTLVEAARLRGESAVGYRLMREMGEAAKSYGVHTNPKKSELVTFSPDDKIVVLAEGQ